LLLNALWRPLAGLLVGTFLRRLAVVVRIGGKSEDAESAISPHVGQRRPEHLRPGVGRSDADLGCDPLVGGMGEGGHQHGASASVLDRLEISEGNTLHERLQQHIVTAQAAAHVNRHHTGRLFNTPQVVVATHIQRRFLGELTCRACEYGRWVAGWEG
jgi:hypothetical protein